MHLLPPERHQAHEHVRAYSRGRWQALIVSLISRIANYQGPRGTPGVTERLMREGDVGVTLSVLYAPFDEMDLQVPYGAPPRGRYFPDLIAQLELVENHAAEHSGEIAVAHSPAELEKLLGGERPILVHAIEGGFHLGDEEGEVRARVAELADRGVAYITLAHLFWRAIATNAPALPFLPDWLYHLVFPQPDEGLAPLGRAAADAMIEQGILIDITHMNERSISDTLSLLDSRDPDKRLPVLATHMACRFGRLEYSFTDDTIKRVAERGGLMGCILCRHYMTSGANQRVQSRDDSLDILCRHIDHIRELAGSFDHVAIGSDLDGYIKPALPGFEHMGHMRALQDGLIGRYGAETAEKISSGNALRVLRAAWRGAPLASTR